MSNYLRNVVCFCVPCRRESDVVCREDDKIRCPECGTEMEQHWWKRGARERTQWDEKDAVVVFKKPDGTYSFPARNDKPTPEGCERIVARSDREVAAIEKAAGVRNESRWFDRGSGKGFDTAPLPRFPR